MTSMIRRLYIIVIVSVFWLSLSGCATRRTIQTPHVTYTVTGQSITVASAVTPYDFDAKARDAFLHWFKRGFDTGLAGNEPLMVTWQETTEGQASQQGYDFGLDQGEKYRQNPKATHASQTISIPPQ